MKHIIFSLLVIIGFGCEQQTQEQPEPEPQSAISLQLTETWRLESGLDRPESAIYYAEEGVIYVTNIVGDGAGMDGVGYIAKVSARDGQMIDSDWVTGLNAPKGIALGTGKLWATDINALVEIALPSGDILGRHQVEAPVYLNDVTVHPDGSVYVTDSRNSKIYRYNGAQLSVWLEDTHIQMPNGAHVIGNELVVVAGDSTADNPGAARYFQAINLDNGTIRSLESAMPDGALDAVEPDGAGGIFTTDWASGRLMYFKEGNGMMLLEQLGQGAADVDYIAETSMLYVPVMQEGQLIAYRVE